MGKYRDITRTLFTFFGKLGYDVYLEGVVPTGAPLPYITISYETNSQMGESTILSGRIWTKVKSASRVPVNEITDKLYELIGEVVKLTIDNDNGYIVFYKGSPFVQPVAEDDLTLQVNYFNLEMQIF